MYTRRLNISRWINTATKMECARTCPFVHPSLSLGAFSRGDLFLFFRRSLPASFSIIVFYFFPWRLSRMYRSFFDRFWAFVMQLIRSFSQRKVKECIIRLSFVYKYIRNWINKLSRFYYFFFPKYSNEISYGNLYRDSIEVYVLQATEGKKTIEVEVITTLRINNQTNKLIKG